jgi:eukaryotic-like serine/threonine-protein kinase
LSRQRHQLAKEIFLEACALDPDERPALLNERCAGDTALRAEVEAQLAADDDPLDLTGARARAQLEQALGAAAAVGAAPMRIGRYRVLGLLGEGGMGAVYEAEQDSPRRRVAIKLLRPGAAAPALVRRFEREAEALGQLQHPGVAQIYEAGVTDVQWPQGPASHQPFFAMELAPGTPLDSYARLRNLDLAARLELVARVCDAVQHAHAKGVIHRDLKPANILVAEDEQGRPAPKILDFGVARLTESDAQAVTMRTEAGQIIGTLPYMSPEQVAGDPGQVDTRTDVYALGVILYELLAGRLPLDVGRSSVAEAARIICDEEPRALSAHDARCRGDVETIVARALEKDPARRYQSPGELAADIRRFLRDEPIQARPPSAAYQLRKFARRNRALVAGAGAAVAALVLGLGVAIAQAWRLSLARDREQTAKVEAQEQAAIATAVNSVLLQIVEAPDPFDLTPVSDVPLDVRVSDVLERVATGTERLSGSPRARAAVHSALCTTYRGLDNPAAVEHARQALALLHAALGPEHEETLRSAHELAASLIRFDQREEAIAIVQASRQTAERTLGPGHWLTLRFMGAHARLRAAGGELVLEAQEVEEVQAAAAIAVGVGIAGGEGVLEAQEVEEVKLATLIAVGVAGGCRRDH